MTNHNFTQPFVVAIIATMSFFVSCDQNDEFANQSVDLSCEHSTSRDGDEIVPIEGDRESLRKPTKTRASYEIKEEIDQLDGIPFYLQVKGNSSTKQFLNATNKGAELTIADYTGSIDQQFRLRILPATSGIPYLIYSQKTATPISIGSYSSQPNVKVLYARADESGSLFGASWDFLKAQYSLNAYAIQNQDSPEQGNSGHWMDIYYPVITVNDSKISFARYNNSPRQEFAIVPVENFEIEQIRFIVDASAVLTQMPDLVFSRSYTNNGPRDQSHTFTISESYKETSSFSRKTSYSVNFSTEFKATVPFIASGKISTSITGGQEFTHGKSEEKTFTISDTYPVLVPARHHAKISLTVFKYNMDVEYVAVCRGLTSGKRINIRGRWNGVDCIESNAVLDMLPLDGPTASRRIEITPQMLRTGKLIEAL